MALHGLQHHSVHSYAFNSPPGLPPSTWCLIRKWGCHLISSCLDPQNWSLEVISSSEYAVQLRDWLQRAYLVVRRKFQREFGQQKIQYDKNVHGKPLAVGDLVWLHFVVTVGLSKNLHRAWTGPFKVLKKLSEQVYCIQSTAGTKTCWWFTSIDWSCTNLLGLRRVGTVLWLIRLSPVSSANEPPAFAEQIQVVECYSFAVASTPPSSNTSRYPQCQHYPLDRFSEGLLLRNAGCITQGRAM